MFATMYSTQAILPELSRDFDVSPSRAGLTISFVVLAVAVGGFVWGPVSDRIGRPRSIRLASLLLVPPTIGVALAPTFEALLVCRTLQGLCMPGLLTVGVPYVAEAFVPRIGARAMGFYVSALVVGGLIGRLGVALASAVVGWRVAIGVLALLPPRRRDRDAERPARAGPASPRRRDRAPPPQPPPDRRLGLRRGAVLHVRRHLHVRHLPARGAAVLVLRRRLQPRLPALADGPDGAADGPARRAGRLAPRRVRHGAPLRLRACS